MRVAALAALALALAPEAWAQGDAMRIGIDVSGTVIPATLLDNAAARDFATRLPLTLTLEDYAQTEKVTDLQAKLSLEGAPEGYTPVAGDIAHYAPWTNLAIFHKNFRYSPGLVKVGRIEGDLGPLAQPGTLRVTIRRIAD